MLKWLKRLLVGLASLTIAAAGIDALTYSPNAWLADYTRLKQDMAQGYANLDWIAEKRGLDLAALDRRTTARLDKAYSRLRALLALRDFVGDFRDPHLALVFESKPAAAMGVVSQIDPPAGADCGSAGYGDEGGDFHPALARLPGWRPLPGNGFPAAVAGRTGFLRIGSFSEISYGEACGQAFRQGQNERALQLATREVLQSQLKARLAQLKRAGATRLVVDLTGNGGGTEWASEAAALFSEAKLERRAALITGARCDRFAVWAGRRPPCPVFAPAEEETIALEGAGAWAGPLFLLADGGSASATEDFIVWLHGSGAATLLGERTHGAGCGYVDGGRTTYFRSAPVAVRMPNCARYLADGTNEIEGIRPDVEVPMAGDIEAIAAALQRALRGDPGG